MIILIKRMIKPINIVKLIEENPNTKLSKPYQGKLINKLKDNFSTCEQQLFISSFYCYLNYKSDDFVIDLDDIWNWLGFTRKDSAKMCLKANTSKANEIHEYYLKLEETLHEVIDEESNELRLQLDKKNNIIEETSKKLEEKENIIEETKEELTKLTRKYVRHPKQKIDGKNVVYLMSPNESVKVGEYVIGKALNINNRQNNYNDGSKIFDYTVMYYVSLESAKLMDIVEAAVLMKLAKYRSKAGRDVFLLPEPDISIFTNVFDECAKFYENVHEDDVVYAKKTKSNEDSEKYNANRKKVVENYSKEKKEEIKAKEREYKIKNEEAFSELGKIEHNENREQRNKISNEYYENNKEDVKQKANEFYSNNKSFILDESKKRYEKNKDEIKEVVKEYYDKNYKDKIFTQRSKKEKCECGLIVTHYRMNKHKKTKKHIILMEIKNNNQTEILDADKKRCECGMIITLPCLQKHIKSNRHKMFIELIEEMKKGEDEDSDDSDNEDEDSENEEKENKSEKDDEICECGFILSSRCMRRHKKTKRHKLLMEKKLNDNMLSKLDLE